MPRYAPSRTKKPTPMPTPVPTVQVISSLEMLAGLVGRGVGVGGSGVALGKRVGARVPWAAPGDPYGRVGGGTWRQRGGGIRFHWRIVAHAQPRDSQGDQRAILIMNYHLQGVVAIGNGGGIPMGQQTILYRQGRTLDEEPGAGWIACVAKGDLAGRETSHTGVTGNGNIALQGLPRQGCVDDHKVWLGGLGKRNVRRTWMGQRQYGYNEQAGNGAHGKHLV